MCLLAQACHPYVAGRGRLFSPIILLAFGTLGSHPFVFLVAGSLSTYLFIFLVLGTQTLSFTFLVLAQLVLEPAPYCHLDQ